MGHAGFQPGMLHVLQHSQGDLQGGAKSHQQGRGYTFGTASGLGIMTLGVWMAFRYGKQAGYRAKPTPGISGIEERREYEVRNRVSTLKWEGVAVGFEQSSHRTTILKQQGLGSLTVREISPPRRNPVGNFRDTDLSCVRNPRLLFWYEPRLSRSPLFRIRLGAATRLQRPRR